MARASLRLTLRDHPFVAEETLRALGLAAEDVLDLTASRNLYGPPPGLLELADSASLIRYPDETASLARARIAERFATTPERIAIGHGAAELLWSLARLWVAPGSTVLAIEPSYPEFMIAAQQLGGRIVRWRSVERTGHRVDLEQVAELIALERPQVVSLCAPGSPTGASVRFDRLQPLAASFPEVQFAVDQTFLELSDD
ncbi:MAG TPA: aminotransferase class I/II-fold pyridoxal phosphate-dependent enzyme, partial [Polyangiales bacterium]|nr:aminotransferase class I/II-fold pyridoxal phosphate-dependent enzyme [Polyangiales bacterium]